MPIYNLKCPKCGHEEERYCTIAERNLQKCGNCGADMKVQITTANMFYRNIKLRHQQWIKERGL